MLFIYRYPSRSALCAVLVMLSICGSAYAAEKLNPIAPAEIFYKPLGVKEDVYYVTSPVSIKRFKTDNHWNYYTVSKLKWVIVKDGYVAIFAENEDMSQRLELAKGNIETIESRLDASVINSNHPLSLNGPGPFEDGAMIAMINSMCHLNFVSQFDKFVETALYAKNVSRVRFCAGFGLFVGLAGYRIVASERGLEFQQVVKVTQPLQ